MGKITELNKRVNKRLKEIYSELDRTRCEICGTDQWLSWHHRHPRVFYRKFPIEDGLANYNQTLLLCVPVCHKKMHDDPKLSDKTFFNLRGSDELEI